MGLCALLVGALTEAPGAAAGAPLASPRPVTAVSRGATPLTWSACPYPGSPASLQCATVKVPLDYAHPQGRQTTVTIDRLKASGGAHRVGSLVFNPGGPGGSGTAIVYFESLGANLFSRGVRRHFDIIGLDPRGVGLSNPVRCSPAILNQRVSLFPRSAAAFHRLKAHNRALARSCLRRTGPLVKHVDTLSAARDIEAIRRALGDGKLNYLGLSYGTLLGETYADLYPHRIRTMALDAALVHSLPVRTMLADEAGGYERSLDRFFRWCRGSSACALHGRNVRRLYRQLVRRANRSPIPAPSCHQPGCRPYVTGEDIRFDTQGLLLFKKPIPLVAPQGWNELAIAIRQARRGDASKLSAPLASSPTDDALNGSAIANECLDWRTPVRHRSDLRRLRRVAQHVAPILRGASQSWTIIAGCVGWPWPPVNPPHRTRVRGTPPVLVVNATHDPSTSYAWARRLSHEITSSVLLTRAGDGHTSYLAHGRSRTRDAIDHYLVTGKTPPAHTVFHN
ncbi:MAG: hypothetical protein QOK15_2000 [Nocardioidaceae bacterium]|jgi:pimeloyl-ACP methyl ester carboxylesterase|nr:hypothetical protein [Nocardioidaceae bacterium]